MQPLPRHGLCDDGPAFFPGPGSVLFALSRLPREGTVIDIPARPVTVRAARLRTKRSISIFPPAFDRSPAARERFWRAGLRGEPSGDLIVNVRVADHERFKRNGDDLYLVSDISIAQAALGCEIEVEGIMPDEVVKVCVPAGAQYGDTVSVNNYGMPRIGGRRFARSSDRAAACGRPHEPFQ